MRNIGIARLSGVQARFTVFPSMTVQTASGCLVVRGFGSGTRRGLWAPLEDFRDGRCVCRRTSSLSAENGSGRAVIGGQSGRCKYRPSRVVMRPSSLFPAAGDGRWMWCDSHVRRRSCGCCEDWCAAWTLKQRLTATTGRTRRSDRNTNLLHQQALDNAHRPRNGRLSIDSYDYGCNRTSPAYLSIQLPSRPPSGPLYQRAGDMRQRVAWQRWSDVGFDFDLPFPFSIPLVSLVEKDQEAPGGVF
ncbi:hypothetical protein P154DRAFT_209078 [Amniculicola lignicola CBS 123094]|uniref:Uncharacterized protein n=1 Tax=Amniculicola lignicola CBS 123094 TaxID=1392246 RepID=A0A6A5WGN2_9PLEO|nr:hypothetical protein P154DRAFT_209078 [Amniculicola lignicola CBS 123094]